MSKINDQEIIERVLAIPTEDRTTEFKRLGLSLKIEKVVESIVAMTNTEGGSIIFGVDDPQKTKQKGLNRVYGIEENPELYDEIGKMIGQSARQSPISGRPIP